MFYRVAYFIIFVLIMLALFMVQLQVDLIVKHDKTGVLRDEVLRLVEWTQMPPPRDILETHDEMIIQFSPYESFRKTKNLVDALRKIQLTGRRPQNLQFTVHLNDNRPELFKSVVKAMGGNQMNFHLLPNTLTLTWLDRGKRGLDCVAMLEVSPPLPNFRILASELSGNDADDEALEAQIIVRSSSALLQNMARLITIDSSSRVSVLIHRYAASDPVPSLSQCQQAALDASDELYAYLFFPMLSSHLRDYRLHYNLDKANLDNI